MGLKKKLPTNDTLEAWTYETGNFTGISVGVFDRMTGNSKSVVSVESVDDECGFVNRIVINKAKAEKYGFEVVIDETGCQ
jgi:hypothetical protein